MLYNTRMYFKNWLISLVKVILFIVLFVIALNFIVDPFQHYRITNWYSIQNEQERYVISGIAKNAEYKTILIGSSVSQNTLVSQLEKAFSTKSIKLTAPALKSNEMNEILKNVFNNHKNIKNIIISLDDFAVKNSLDADVENTLPMYLYDTKRLNDIKYLASFATLNKSISALTKITNKKQDFDKLWFWEKTIFSKQMTIDFYKKNGSVGMFNSMKSTFSQLNTHSIMKKNFNEHILPHINLYPLTKFYIYYPPYSYLYIHDNFTVDDIIFKQYIFELSKEYKNIYLYDFQCSKIVYDLDNYKDPIHFSPNYNQLVLDSMHLDANRVTTQNKLDSCNEYILNIMNQEIKL